MFHIEFYTDADGNSPLVEYLKPIAARSETDKNAKKIIEKFYYALEMLKRTGTYSGSKFTKHVGGKIWELRSDDHRTFFFAVQGNTFVMLHMFRKQTQKTPKREIERAKRELADWENRHL